MNNHLKYRHLYINPLLVEIDLYSPEASDLLVMTLAHSMERKSIQNTLYSIETTFGAYQMYKGTFNDLWYRYLADKYDLVKKILFLCCYIDEPIAEDMEDIKFATIMARVFYERVREPIPTDLDEIAAYAKKYWDTEAGSSTVENFLSSYLRFTKID